MRGHNTIHRIISHSAIALVLMFSIPFVAFGQAHAAEEPAKSDRLVTIHDRGEDKVILTHAATVQDALNDAKISVVSEDNVEPGLDTQLVASDYTVNIYRARPVIVVDGLVREKIMTAAQTPEGITKDAGISLHDEDQTSIAPSTDIISDGASDILTIDRATEFTLNLYGNKTTAYSHEATVGEMLDAKGIHLGEKDTVSVGLDAPIKAGMTVSIWRDGVQTTTVQEAIPFPTRYVQDFDHPVGYSNIQTPGVNGKKSVTYEITVEGGKEVSRNVIQSVVLSQPKPQVEVVGAALPPGSHTDWPAWPDERGKFVGIMPELAKRSDLPDQILQWLCRGSLRQLVRGLYLLAIA